jgi:hypothetical protein
VANTINSDMPKGLGDIEGSLLYLAGPEEQLATTALDQRPPDEAGWPGRCGRYTVPIHNGRPIIRDLSLDRQGFVLVRSQTAVTNFYDKQEVHAVYYPELERLIKHTTGAIKVVVFAHDVRSILKARAGELGVREPVGPVHNDYTIKSAPEHVRELLDADEADERLKHRYVEINAWRPIRGPVQNTPLAVCDSQSIAQNDLVPADLKHEVYMVRFSTRHRWFYFPAMETNEVLLIKGFDSMEDGRARFTAHAAVEDPTAPAFAPARESIEARALVFYRPGLTPESDRRNIPGYGQIEIKS